ncbi:Nucleotide binding protein [Hirschfeldia incana]|nr:Nucleotide binding protein [Hirschfeldia incana]
MDVFISEEYVHRRRMEKKAAAVAGKNVRLGFCTSKIQEKRKSNPRMSESRPENEFTVVGGGVYESFVFQCFSP